ncbi:MAG: peptide deformylase [Bdellovibrionales bacterium]|nr:peptide deformylase [Bdellovibrionales bacterium]
MSLLELVYLPDPRLREKSKEVKDFSPELKKLVSDMSETMVWAKGIGLAAVQVGVHKRLLIIDIGDLDENDSYIEGDEESERRLAEKKTVSKIEVFINPVILEANGEIEYEEGCLSVPGVYSNVKRKEKLKLRYQDLEGKTHEIETHGLKSIVLQHEMDHLDGIVFTDKLGPMQRMMVLDKYNKLQAKKKAAKQKTPVE